jgi:hypothetical protein
MEQQYSLSGYELDNVLVTLGLITEGERIRRGYQLIHAAQMKRHYLFPKSHDAGALSHDPTNP